MTEVQTEQVVPMLDAMDLMSARIRDIEEMNRRQRDELVAKAELIRQLTGDLATIAEAVRDEAERRDWCSEYGDWVDAINERLSTPRMKHCFHTYLATFSVEVDFTIEQRRSVDDVIAEIAVALDEIPNLTNATDVSMTVEHLRTESE